MFADDRCLKMKAATLQDRASLNEHVEALLGNESTDAQCAQTISFRGRVRCVQQQVSEFSVQTVVDAANISVGFNVEQVLAVGVSASNDKLRCVHLASQQPGGIERLAIDVFGVSRERKRQAGDDRREPRNCGRAMTEVRVNVADVTCIKNQPGNPNCLEKLFQV